MRNVRLYDFQILREFSSPATRPRSVSTYGMEIRYAFPEDDIGIEVAIGPISLLVRFDAFGITGAAWFYDDAPDTLDPVLRVEVGRA